MRSGLREVLDGLDALATHLAGEGERGPYVADVAAKYSAAVTRAQDASWAAYYGGLGVQELATGAEWLQRPDAERDALVARARAAVDAFATSPYADAELAQWQTEHGVTADQILRKDGPPPVWTPPQG